MQGYLLKQTSDFRKAWKRRFFVLDSQGMLYYYSTKEGSRREQQPRNTCSLLTATIKPSAEVGARRGRGDRRRRGWSRGPGGEEHAQSAAQPHRSTSPVSLSTP